VTFLLDHLPENAGVAITTRADPPLPVARLRNRGDLLELRAADLRFTPREAAGVLNDVTCLGLDEFIEGFTGSHRFVLDYLVEEVDVMRVAMSALAQPLRYRKTPRRSIPMTRSHSESPRSTSGLARGPSADRRRPAYPAAIRREDCRRDRPDGLTRSDARQSKPAVSSGRVRGVRP
jgi:hypothetical protein